MENIGARGLEAGTQSDCCKLSAQGKRKSKLSARAVQEEESVRNCNDLQCEYWLEVSSFKGSPLPTKPNLLSGIR